MTIIGLVIVFLALVFFVPPEAGTKCGGKWPLPERRTREREIASRLEWEDDLRCD